MLREGLNYYCIDCWCEIEPCLTSLCSMRCQDCRDGLNEIVEYVEPWPVWFARTQGVPA